MGWAARRGISIQVITGYDQQGEHLADTRFGYTMSLYTLGVLADTHIHDARRPLPAAILEAFAGVDAILHAGDIACNAVLDRLATLAPVHAVHGNVDPPELCRELPDRLALSYGDVSIGLTHGHIGNGSTTPDRALAHCLEAGHVDVVVFGHSHIPCNERRGEVLLFNPGSATERRRQPWTSYGLLVIEAGRVEGRIVPLAWHG